MYSRIEGCRICGNQSLEPILDLGEQMLTGVFPSHPGADVTVGPLRLVKCVGGDQVCGLLQLEHSYDLAEMYGENYGYRSGLNPSMVDHLACKVARIGSLIQLRPGDLVVDIGSNDGTTLAHYKQPGLKLVGVDPTGHKFAPYYKKHVELIPDFFSAEVLLDHSDGQKAKVITSFSMFYDLPAPMEFMRQVHKVLADDGMWVSEQSYMPEMLATNSYDTICHEHLEFYALKQIKWMADRVGFQIIDVEFNGVNGGSFSFTAAKGEPNGSLPEHVKNVLDAEKQSGLDGLEPYLAFADRVRLSRDDLLAFVGRAKSEGKKIAAIGASTKGNVLLQYCGIGPDTLIAVGEINADKFGCYTPGTWIPIVPENKLLAQETDFLLVLPWHFRSFFERSANYDRHALVFPLPTLSVRESRSA